MTTAFFSHRDCWDHVTPDGHPERVARLDAIMGALAGLDLDRREAPVGEVEDVLRCHPQAYHDRIAEAAPGPLDADTWMSAGSYAAAMRAVGAACTAVDAVMAGEVSNAFCATRPPGHHAETETPMGFCLFGTISIAAKRALQHHGLARVAVVDFDVHHGNGTQDLLWNEKGALFIGSHQMPLWPGSGHPSESGAHDNVMNLPLPPGAGSEAFRSLYEDRVFPALKAFNPDFLLISAGFDAHASDPLASLNFQTDDFGWVTERLCDVADEVCEGRVVSTLEGGYDLDALAASVAAHVGVLKERGA